MLSRVNLNKHRLLISTGMSSINEISKTLNFIAKKIYVFKKNKIKVNNEKILKFLKRKYVYFIATDYPVSNQYANLRAIETLSKFLNCRWDILMHTLGISAPLIAVSIGAKYIEKHLTLDKNLRGPDHKASLNPVEFKEMVKQIRNYEQMIGNGIKKPQKCELINMKIARKSIVASCYILKGEMFNKNNITVKRPAGGIDPTRYSEILGKKAKKII